MDDSMEESSLKALLTNTRAMVSNALALAERFVTWSFREESFSLADVVDTGLLLRCCCCGTCGCSGCSCGCRCGMHCCGCGQVGVGGWVGHTFWDGICWQTLVSILFRTGRNVPWEVADMDDSMEESSLKALLTNTRAMVSNALALAERFVTWSFREESFSLADVVDTGLWLQCCSCCGSCGCSCGGLVGGGR